MSKDRLIVKELFIAVSEKIYNFGRVSADYNRICAANIQVTHRKFLITVALLLMSYTTMAIGPLYVLIRYNQHTTLMSLTIPFVRPLSSAEYVINVFMQTIAFMVGCPGNFAMEGVFALVMDSINMSTAVVQLHCTKLSKRLSVGQSTAIEQRMALIVIMREITVMNEYASMLRL